MRLKRNKFFIIAVLALMVCIFLEMQDFVYSSDKIGRASCRERVFITV